MDAGRSAIAIAPTVLGFEHPVAWIIQLVTRGKRLDIFLKVLTLITLPNCLLPSHSRMVDTDKQVFGDSY